MISNLLGMLHLVASHGEATPPPDSNYLEIYKELFVVEASVSPLRRELGSDEICVRQVEDGNRRGYFVHVDIEFGTNHLGSVPLDACLGVLFAEGLFLEGPSQVMLLGTVLDDGSVRIFEWNYGPSPFLISEQEAAIFAEFADLERLVEVGAFRLE